MKINGEKELPAQISKLQKEIDRLKKSVKQKKYGLVWMDVPEAFENDVENKLPILKEEPEKAIINKDGKSTHILIEGDNYHALTCLNYTHKGKIDVIYIDPPYNIGNDGFRYKDKRFIDKYPDGTEVKKDNPFRHSYWLSFMKKRLELCRDLLKDTGVFIVSIDDNEFAQLKLLCDEIFSRPAKQENFIANIIRNTNSTKSNSNFISVSHDYALIYAKNISLLTDELQGKNAKWEVKKNNVDEYVKYVRNLQDKGLSNGQITEELKELTKYPRFVDFVNYWYVDDKGVYRKDNIGGISGESGNMQPLMNPLTKKYDPVPPGGYRYSPEALKQLIADNRIHFHTDGSLPTPKRYLSENLTQRPKGIMSDDQRPDYNLLKVMEIEFDNPKQLAFIKRIFSIFSKNSIFLDFFAGSGTSGHAVIDLNYEDDGCRQFILVTNNENNICDNVCYPRIKNVMCGFENKKSKKQIIGEGSSLKYFRTAFIGKHNVLRATDEDKTELAHQAGDLLALAENTLYKAKENKFWQLYENRERYTAVYFREELDKFDEFVEMVEKLKCLTTVYVFSWGDEEFAEEFEHIDGVKVKTIPLPILEIYKNIYNLG